MSVAYLYFVEGRNWVAKAGCHAFCIIYIARHNSVGGFLWTFLLVSLTEEACPFSHDPSVIAAALGMTAPMINPNAPTYKTTWLVVGIRFSFEVKTRGTDLGDEKATEYSVLRCL